MAAPAPAAASTPIVTLASWQRSLVHACRDNIPDWIQTSKKVNALLEQERLAFHLPATPVERKINAELIVGRMCALEQEVEAAGQFEHRYCELMDLGLKAITEPSPSDFEFQFSRGPYTYRRWRGDLEKCMDLNVKLMERAKYLVATRITKPWEKLSTELEAVLSTVGKSVGLFSSIWGYLPKRLGGTWPYRNAAFDEYKKLHAAETPVHHPRPMRHIAPEEPVDLTSGGTKKELKRVAAEIYEFWVNGLKEM